MWYFDVLEIKVSGSYVALVFLGHSRHTDLYNSFTSMMDELSEDKLVQLSMDGPSVNVKLLQAVQDDRKDKGLSHLLDMGTCGLHTLLESFKMGIEKSEWNESLMNEKKNLSWKHPSIYFMTLQLDGMTMKVWQNLQNCCSFFVDWRCGSCR